MLFFYPNNAITVKDNDRFTYLTYLSLSINMNRLNNDSSSTFHMLDISARELLRSKLDLSYLPTFGINAVDFVAIDRINRFNISQISNFIDRSSGYAKCDKPIKGYSLYSNTIYDLKNCNTFTDFTRHSIPVDIMLEKAGDITNVDADIVLKPNEKVVLSPTFKVNKSRATITLLNYNIADKMAVFDPYMVVSGTDIEYNTVSERINIDSAFNISTKNEYIEIESITLFGLTDQISVNVLPYIVNKTAVLEFDYVDREDFFQLPSVFSLDQVGKKLNISRINDSSFYPGKLEAYEEIDLNMPESYTILNYHFDTPNQLLYTVCSDAGNNKYLYIFPIIIPHYLTNLKECKSTPEQAIKVEYIKDTIGRKYVFSVFPSDKRHGVEQLSISIISPFNVARGIWYQSTLYNVGDMVIFSGREYICVTEHTSASVFDLSKFSVQVEYVVEGFLLDLISYGIETNKFEISFDKLFKSDCEAIIQFDASGDTPSTLQILAQNHKLNPVVSKNISTIMTYFNANNIVSDNNVIIPVENRSNKLLSDKINSYNYGVFPSVNYQTTDFNVFSVSSNQGINLNNYLMINIFDTFYLDWNNGNIITSDTITHIINTDSDTYTVLDGQVSYTGQHLENSDDYIRTFSI